VADLTETVLFYGASRHPDFSGSGPDGTPCTAPGENEGKWSNMHRNRTNRLQKVADLTETFVFYGISGHPDFSGSGPYGVWRHPKTKENGQICIGFGLIGYRKWRI
jgi:hypothetical protein